ncbi:MAG: chemotaxis protein CheW [Chloroflexi bacterium HGW-Chloroflexi-5]|jgi:purine-binding chemotaxis protein CheW|nr:MAG: chemotaxis protein CheW [Chloroflexi bacterium HGW-Chloroflexi-5]
MIMSTQMVVFKLLSEEYAVDVSSVEAIIKLQAITKVPHAQAHVVGVTNLRGNIVPVIDLKKRLELPEKENSIDTRIIVALLQDSKVGMVVDAVSQVIEIEDSQIEPTPQISTSIDSTYIRGIVKIESHLVIMLDLTKIFSDEKNKTQV